MLFSKQIYEQKHRATDVKFLKDSAGRRITFEPRRLRRDYHVVVGIARRSHKQRAKTPPTGKKAAYAHPNNDRGGNTVYTYAEREKSIGEVKRCNRSARK